MTDRVLILGGPGNLSTSTIKLLLQRGYQVGVYSHPTYFQELDREVCTFAGDHHDDPNLAETMREFKPDVVIDFICFTPDEAEQLIPLVDGKLRQFIFISTVDVYGYPLSHLPFREDDQWNSATKSEYAANKRLCEAIFKARDDPAKFPLTIARPAYSFGPRFLLSFTSREYGLHLLRRLKSGRPILVPGDGTTLIHVSSADNTGRMIAALVDAPQALGKDYTCGHPTFTTHAGYINLLARALGVGPVPIYIPTEVIVSHRDPFAKTCLLHELTRFNVAFSIDRFLRDFPEFRWEVSLESWTRSVVEWHQHSGLLDVADDEIFDDRVIRAWQKCMQFYEKE